MARRHKDCEQRALARPPAAGAPAGACSVVGTAATAGHPMGLVVAAATAATAVAATPVEAAGPERCKPPGVHNWVAHIDGTQKTAAVAAVAIGWLRIGERTKGQLRGHYND